MAFLSLVGPALRSYLQAKLPAVGHRSNSWCTHGIGVLAVMLILAGVLFGLSGLYEYFTVMYTSLWAKVYMAVTLILLGSIGSVVALISNTIQQSWQRHKNLKALTELEQYAQSSLETIRQEGEYIFKEHPFASVLAGLALGVLSGKTGTFKRTH